MTANRTATTVEWNPANDAVSVAILEAVAEANGVDPLEISTPLYDVVDPDAVDHLFETSGRRADHPGHRLTFRYEGCEITVESEGTVTARPAVPDDGSRAAPAVEAGVGRQ